MQVSRHQFCSGQLLALHPGHGTATASACVCCRRDEQRARAYRGTGFGLKQTGHIYSLFSHELEINISLQKLCGLSEYPAFTDFEKHIIEAKTNPSFKLMQKRFFFQEHCSANQQFLLLCYLISFAKYKYHF